MRTGSCFNRVLRARCLGKGQTQGKRDPAGRTQPDKPDGSDKLGREPLSSVKYSQADGKPGEGEEASNVDLCESSWEGRSGDGAQHSQETRACLALWKKGCPPQLPKQQELCVLGTT